MAKSSNMKDLLKQRMSAAQQVSEMEIGNRAYESLIDPFPAAASTIRELSVDKLRPFFTTDIGFHPYPAEKLRAFAQQLLEQGLLERIIVRSIPGSDEYEILAGHNRTAAWRMAGHDTIPAEVVVAGDARAAADKKRSAPSKKITFDRRKFAPYLEQIGSEAELEKMFLEFLKETAHKCATLSR